MILKTYTSERIKVVDSDLIRTAITRCREASPLKWYRTILLSLQQLYSTLQEEGSGVVNHTSSEWSELKVSHRPH